MLLFWGGFPDAPQDARYCMHLHFTANLQTCQYAYSVDREKRYCSIMAVNFALRTASS